MISWKRGALGVLGAGALLMQGGLMGSNALGNGFRNPWEGAAAISRTGGRIAWTDDATATVHNPANLAHIKDPEFLSTAAFGYNGGEFKGPDGRSGETESPWKVLPGLFGAWPIQHSPVVLAVGVSSPFGQFTKYEKESSPFRFTAPHFARERTIDVTPTAAVWLNGQLRVGAGLNVMHSQLKFQQEIPFSELTGNPTTPPGGADVEVDGVGVGAHIGITWDPAPRHRLAATYRSRIKIDHEGDFDVDGIPPELVGAVVPRTGLRSEFSFPAIAAVSYGWRMRETLRWGIDVEWVEASVYDELPLDAEANQFLLPGPSIPQDWNDNWTVGAGLEWDGWEDTTLFAGYLFMETPVPEETMAPTLVDADRHILSIGARREWGRSRLEAGYAFIVFDDVEIATNQNPAYLGTYDLYAQVIALSYKISF